MTSILIFLDIKMGLSGRHTVVRRKWDALDESRVGIVDVDVAEVFEAMEHGASHDGVIVLMRLYTMVIIVWFEVSCIDRMVTCVQSDGSNG